MFKTNIFLCLTTSITFSYGLNGLPEYIRVCPKNGDAIQCIIDNVERLRPYVTKGIPELGIQGIEPINLGDLLISERTNNNGISITAKNIKAFGPSTFTVKKLDIVRWSEEYQFDIFFPHLYVEGAYNVDGQILLFPIKGSGTFTGNFTSCSGSVTVVLPMHSPNDMVSVQKFDIDIKLGNGSIKLQNLFNGDKVLGEAINDVINDNFDLLSKDIVPLVKKALQRRYKKMANTLGSRYTFSELFPLM